jgi:glycosyltransferase involved in cell wall biosynthesis
MPRGALSSVSIAMATYNGAAFLEEQLDSLETQTLKPDELVVCDDQSSDSTVDILRRFATRASFPVRIHVNPERLGWRANFMKASGLCSHELIAFCDQDDVWYPDKLATVVAEFDDPSVLLAFHNADLVDAYGNEYGTLLPVDRAPRRIAARSRPTPWSNPLGLTIVFRSTLVRYNDLWVDSKDLAFPGHPAAHDQWFYFLATNLGTVVSLPQRLLGYRQHRGNVVGWTNVPTKKHRANRQEVAADIVRILAMLVPFCVALGKARDFDGPLAPAFAAAHAKNLALVGRLERRLELYAASRLHRRVDALRALLSNHDYAQGQDWGLGRRALVQDLTTGLFGRPTSRAP